MGERDALEQELGARLPLALPLRGAEGDAEAHADAVMLPLGEPQCVEESDKEAQAEAVLLLLPLAAAEGDSESVAAGEGEALGHELGAPLLLPLALNEVEGAAEEERATLPLPK